MDMLLTHIRNLGPETLLRTFEHIYLTFIAMTIAIAIAVPVGIFVARSRWKHLNSFIMNLASVIQTVPSLALIAFIVVLFAVMLLPTVGVVPALVALILYALLPILKNTSTGIMQVDPAIREVARGMGMRPRQVLFQVELPVSLPFIMAGIRIATVWTIGVATLCGLIGAGGLGDFIIRGLRSMRMDYLLAGTVPAAILALCFYWLLGKIEHWLTSPGLRVSRTKT